MTKHWILEVKKDENGEPMIEFPDDFLEETKWNAGDRIQWIDRKDGSWEMKKLETQLVLVECVSQFRIRYVVEVPTGVCPITGKPKEIWALDTVTMGEAKEFSQEHLDELIVSHRVISRDDVIKLCDQDNDYCRDWTDEKKIEAFVTEWKEDDITR
jgi:hypothetical protein